MALTTIITGRMPATTDLPFKAAELVFTLSDWDKAGGDVFPPAMARSVLLTSDGTIPVGFALWRNSAGQRSTTYIVTARWSEEDRQRGQVPRETPLGRIYLTGPGPVALADLLALPAPIPNVPDALAQALGAAASASADAALTSDARGAVETMRDEVVNLAQFPLAKGFPTRASAIASTDDLSLYGALQTLGLNSVGDGGGLAYLRVATVGDLREGGFTAGDGSFWNPAPGQLLRAPSATDARKTLRVKPDGSGYYLTSRQMIWILAYSQSNFRRLGTVTWDVPANLFIWNGGWDGTIGTAFESPFGGNIRLPAAYAKRVAEENPDADVMLVICASGGVGVRTVVGMHYKWATNTSGDPGTGKIGFNSATMGSVNQVRFNETDADGWVRFIGGTDLGQGATSTAQIVSAADPAVFVKFDITSGGTDAGPYRHQACTVVEASSWPPADGTDIIVYPDLDPLRDVIRINSEAAFNAMGMIGAERNFDEILIWPTESDVVYRDSYIGRDYPLLMDFMKTWSGPETQYVHTLPWPWTTTAQASVKAWWRDLRKMWGRDSSRHTLVDLRSTTAANWEPGVNDYVHVNTGSDMLIVGSLMHASARKGGMSWADSDSGYWAPVCFAGANVEGSPAISGINTAWWSLSGDTVSFSALINIDPVAASVSTVVEFSLPVASDLRQSTDLVGTVALGNGQIVGMLSANPTNDRCVLTYIPAVIGPHNVWVSGRYRIL